VLSTLSPSLTTTVTTTSPACGTSFQSCPASLGGGCCPTDRICGTSSLCPLPPGSTESITSTTSTTSSQITTSTTSGQVVPVRPTGITSTSTSIPSTGTACPTGFYACEAYYAGGCCMTGRNCDTTSCPATSSTTIVTEGRTIIVPVGQAATVTSPTGSCATGWSSCAASVGGGCCIDGWNCGTASCSSVGPTNTVVAQKSSPSSAHLNKRVGLLEAVGVAFACFLVLI
jgi:hypothetical protein